MRRAIGVIAPRRSAAPAIAASAPAISSTRRVLCALKLRARRCMPESWRLGRTEPSALDARALLRRPPRATWPGGGNANGYSHFPFRLGRQALDLQPTSYEG